MHSDKKHAFVRCNTKKNVKRNNRDFVPPNTCAELLRFEDSVAIIYWNCAPSTFSQFGFSKHSTFIELCDPWPWSRNDRRLDDEWPWPIPSRSGKSLASFFIDAFPCCLCDRDEKTKSWFHRQTSKLSVLSREQKRRWSERKQVVLHSACIHDVQNCLSHQVTTTVALNDWCCNPR